MQVVKPESPIQEFAVNVLLAVIVTMLDAMEQAVEVAVRLFVRRDGVPV